MTAPQTGLLLLLLLLSSSSWSPPRVDAQGDFAQQCLAQYKHGRVDFILDAEDSVKDGATYLLSPKVASYRDCVLSCCKAPRCNVAFMERDGDEGRVKSCFLFDCLYKQKYVCRFVRKAGFTNYFLDSVYENDLALEAEPGMRRLGAPR